MRAGNTRTEAFPQRLSMVDVPRGYGVKNIESSNLAFCTWIPYCKDELRGVPLAATAHTVRPLVKPYSVPRVCAGGPAQRRKAARKVLYLD